MNLIETNKEVFELYYQFLIEENNKYNLTAITDKNEVYIKHYADSLLLSSCVDLKNNVSICDVGSGAGFPGIPLKICFPNIDLTIIEPTQKRVKFLKALCEKLNIKVNIINSRVEDVASDFEEKFDIVTARAVASTNILVELLAKICKVNGNIVLYKGDKAEEELKNAQKAMQVLSLNVQSIKQFELEQGYGTRNLIVLTKMKSTGNKYPRRYAEIIRKPL